MIKKCTLATILLFLVLAMLITSSCGGKVNNQLSINSTPPTIQVAGIDTLELVQLRTVVDDVVVYAKTSANQDQKRLLSQIETILGVVKSDSKIDNVVLQKTENEQIILAFLEGTVGILTEPLLGIKSEIAAYLAKGIGDLSGKITEWWETRKIGWVKITVPDKGTITLVYQKDLKEVWVTCDVPNPAGSVSMYTPVEISVVQPDNAGSSAASVMLKALVGNSKVAYRFGGTSATATHPTTQAIENTSTVVGTSTVHNISAAAFSDFTIVYTHGGGIVKTYDSSYYGQIFRITGKVFDTLISGVSLEGSHGYVVRCYFKNENDIKNLKLDQEVIIEGTFTDWYDYWPETGPVLQNCRLISP
jgi:hypothetical protein